jgi:hypothetical protein
VAPPTAPQVVLAPKPSPGSAPQRAGSSSDTLVERIFRDVVDTLGGDAERNDSWEPRSGNDR